MVYCRYEDDKCCGNGVSLDGASADIAAYDEERLPANAGIALLSVESDAEALAERNWLRRSFYRSVR
jgi:hypothetical protein